MPQVPKPHAVERQSCAATPSPSLFCLHVHHRPDMIENQPTLRMILSLPSLQTFLWKCRLISSGEGKKEKQWTCFCTSFLCFFCSIRDFQWSQSNFRLVAKKRSKSAPHCIAIIIHFPQDQFLWKKLWFTEMQRFIWSCLHSTGFCGAEDKQLEPYLSFLTISSLGTVMVKSLAAIRWNWCCGSRHVAS